MKEQEKENVQKVKKMKKTIKITIYIALFCVGLASNSYIADAQSTNPSLEPEEKDCHDKIHVGKNSFSNYCADCRRKQGNRFEHPNTCK